MSERMRYVGTLTSANTEIDALLSDIPWSFQLSGTFGGATVTTTLGNKDDSDVYQYGGVADNTFTDEGGATSYAPASRVKFTATSTSGTTDIDVFLSGDHD